MATQTTHTATITKGNGLTTQINTLNVAPTAQVRLVDALTTHARSVIAQQPGLVAFAVHRSTDGERVVTYGQWQSAEALAAAEAAAMFPQADLALAADPHTFAVVYTNDATPAGMTTISEGNEYATFINVMHTTPDRQAALVEYVISNDNAVFTPHPGFRSANFHRSLDGERVVNYSLWENEAAFLDAINGMMHVPGLTMAQANTLAARAAGDRGWTDFRFYRVEAVVTP